MIIQAGFDFQLIARPFIVPDGYLLPRLVVMGLDSEMQLDTIEVVSDEFAGTLEPFRDAILNAFDPKWTKYFAIAHAGIWCENSYDDPILVEARLLAEETEKQGVHMIGHFGIDETGYMSAMAHSYFDQYPSHKDLPRTMTHWVHSKIGVCG
ncbi:hypothetical protein [Arthrobacter sp. ISL-30]|uniref:hypothetical protein n=1 Tax=Arthrobacter sp. ISL-30 TaxID=2819109 RepID=UPI001BEC4ABF|nr:hypothetical protein [Arthrobacter sp. ISL-30]MBT2513669.1 hypothetical protein [Arthrobacter sp. ISL-30]